MSNQNNNSSNASANSDGNGTSVFNQQQQSARAAMLHSLSKLTQPQIQQLVAKYSKSIELANQAPPSSDLQKQHFATAAKIKEILINYSQLQKLKQQQQQANNNNNNNNNNSDNNNNNGNSVSNATGNINMNNTTDNTITSNTNTTNNNNNNSNMNNTNPQTATAIRPPSSSSTDKQQQSAQPNLVNAPLMIQVQNLKRLSFIYQEHQKKLKSYKSFMERPNLTPDTVNKLRLEATQVQQKMEQIKVAIYKLNQSLKQNRVNLSTLAQKQNNNNNAGGNSIADNNSNDNNNTTSPGSNVSRTPNIGMAQLSSPVATGAASVLSPRNVASSPVMASQVSTPKTPVIAGSARPAIPSAGVAASVTTPQNTMNANANAAAANITIPPAIMSKIQSSASVFIQQILAKGSVTLGGQEFNLNTMSPQHKVAFIKQISARYQQQQINLIKQRQLQQQQRQTNNAVGTTNATTQQQQLLNQLMASNTMTPQQKAQILQRLQNSQRTAAQQQQQNAVSVPGSPIVTPVPIRTNQQISIPKGGASSIQTNKSANNNLKRAIPQGLSISAPNAAVLGSTAGANVTTPSVPGTPSVPATPLAATSDASGGIGSAAGKKKSGSGSGRTQPVQGKSVSGSSGKSSKKNEAKKLKKLESGLSSGSGIDVSAVGGGGSGSHHRTSISTSSMSNSGGVPGQQQPVFSNNTNNKAVEKLKFNTVTENGRQQLFIHQGKMKRKIADIELYTPEADIIGKTAEFSASWKKHFTQSIPLASYKKTAHIKGILNTPKYLQLPEVTEIDQQNLDDSSNSTSTAVAGTTGISGSSLTGSTSGSNTESGGSEGDLITKSKLKELIQSVNPNISIDGDVEDILLDISDEFIYNLCRFSCNLAKRRKTDSIEVKDVQLHLDRFYNIKIPGFDSDEIRNIRKWAPTNGYLNKISGVEVSRSVDRQEK